MAKRIQITFTKDNFRDLDRRFAALQRGNDAILSRIATEATQKSRDTFRKGLSGRPLAPSRDNRPTTGGNFANFIQWIPAKGPSGSFVRFRIELLQGVAGRYWLAQEIGTGETAEFVFARRRESVSVPSQIGRTIPGGYSFADASGRFAPYSGNLGGGQVRSVSDIKGGVPFIRERKIGREIKGKHYIREGGRLARRRYSSELQALINRTFQ